MPPGGINQKSDTLNNVDRVAEVFREYGEFIRSVIRFRVGNEAEAEDLFQDLFLFLVSKPIPRDVRNMRAFLYKLIHDMSTDAFRRIQLYHEKLRRYALRRAHAHVNRPERTLMNVEEANRMLDCIDRLLPPKRAQAVRLTFGDNCDMRKAAETMGVEPKSISRYVCVGLREIRSVFAKRARR